MGKIMIWLELTRKRLQVEDQGVISKQPNAPSLDPIKNEKSRRRSAVAQLTQRGLSNKRLIVNDRI